MRNIAFVAVVALVTVLLIGAFIAVRTPEESTALASPTPPGTRTPNATSTPEIAIPRISVAPPPAPTLIGTYVNQTQKFSLVLPPPYRPWTRAITGAVPSQPDQFAFTARTEADEASIDTSGCHTACPLWQGAAYVIVSPGRASQTLRDFYAKEQGASVRDVITDTTVDRRPAIKVAPGAVYPMEFIIKDGDRIVVVAYQIYPPENGMAMPAGATKEKLDAILASFTFLP